MNECKGEQFACVVVCALSSCSDPDRVGGKQEFPFFQGCHSHKWTTRTSRYDMRYAQIVAVSWEHVEQMKVPLQLTKMELCKKTDEQKQMHYFSQVVKSLENSFLPYRSPSEIVYPNLSSSVVSSPEQQTCHPGCDPNFGSRKQRYCQVDLAISRSHSCDLLLCVGTTLVPVTTFSTSISFKFRCGSNSRVRTFCVCWNNIPLVQLIQLFPVSDAIIAGE